MLKLPEIFARHSNYNSLNGATTFGTTTVGITTLSMTDYITTVVYAERNNEVELLVMLNFVKLYVFVILTVVILTVLSLNVLNTVLF
jgi:hypothetical protein